MFQTSFANEAVVGSHARARSRGAKSHAMANCNRRRVVDQAKCEANVAIHSQTDVGDDDKSCDALHQSTRQESQLPQSI